MNFKTICTAVIFVLLFFSSEKLFAQKPSKENTPVVTTMEQYKKMYDLAMKYADYTSATQSVYAMMAMDTGNIALKDTLANLFFGRGLYQQCILIAQQLYVKQPDNNRMLELLAVSEQSIGNSKEALDYYEVLYPRNKQLYYLYQMIILQYNLKRIGECNQNIETILNDTDAEKQQITMNIGQGYSQNVPYKAAALNIKGVIAKDLNENDVAKKCFEDALKIYPDFVLAKSNLDEMNKPTTTDDKSKVSGDK